MKCIKLFVITVALLVSAQAMAAVGAMSKDEARDGTLVCFDKEVKDFTNKSDNYNHPEKHSADVANAK